LDEALKTPQEWREYLGRLSLGDLGRAKDELESVATRLSEMLGNLHYALTEVQDTIKSRQEDVEIQRRKQRRSKAVLSLREFLSQAKLEVDIALKELPLCTKTGATVRLEGLYFQAEGKQVEAKTANAAKELFQKGLVPNAYYRLFYVRGGIRSAGFGWERPFLDEVFLTKK